MKTLHMVGISAALVLAVTFINVEGRDQMNSITISKIRSLDPDLQKEGVSELLQERQKLIADLIGILKHEAKNAEGEKTRSSLVAAMDVLGEMRAIEAVNILVNYIEFPASDKPLVFDRITPPSETYPAVKALVKIGNPSLPAVIESVKESDQGKDVLLTNCGWIISQVLGAKLGKVYLEDALNNEKDSKKQTRIASLLRFFEPGM